MDITIDISMERASDGEAKTITLTDVPEGTTDKDIERRLIQEGVIRTQRQDIAARRAAANAPLQRQLNKISKSGQLVADVPFSETRAAAEMEGLDVTGADPLTRARASFGNIPILGGDSVPAVKNALEAEYGMPVPVDVRRVGPDREEVIVFQDPETNRWGVFNRPGLDIGDIPGFTGEGLVMISDIGGMLLGGGAGVAAGGPSGLFLGLVAGSGAGAFLGELTRQVVGKGLKVNDNEWPEMVENAGKVAGFSMAFTVLPEGFLKLGKGIMNMLKGRNFGVTAEDLGLDNETYEALIDHINAVIKGQGKEFQPRASQRGSDELLFLDEKFRTTPSLGKSSAEPKAGPSERFFTSIYRDQDRANLDALQEFEARMSALTGAKEGEDLFVGERIQQSIAKREVSPAERTIDDQLRGIEDRALQFEARTIPESEAEIAGAKIRGVAEKEQQALKDTFGNRWQAFRQGEVAQLRSEGTHLQAFSRDISRRKKRAIFPTLEKENARLAQILKDVKEGKGVSMLQVQEALERVNYRIRQIQRGSSSAESIDENTLLAAKRALKRERNQILKDNGRDDLITEVQLLEEQYRDAKAIVDETIIGRIMDYQPGKGYVIKNEDLVRRIIKPRNKAAAERLAQAIDDQGDIEARDAIRKEILALYREKVFKRESLDKSVKLPDRRAHQAFLAQYEDVITPFLSKQEIATLSQHGRLAREIEISLIRHKELHRALKKRVSSRIVNMNPEDLAKFVLDPENTVKAGEMRSLLKREPELWNHFQGEVLQRIRGQIMRGGEFHFEAIDTFLKGRMNKTLEILLGKQYVNDLKVLRDGLAMIQRRPELKGAPPEPGGLGTIMRNIYRALFFPPLSQRGRGFTAVTTGQQTRMTQLMGEVLQDPDALHKVLSVRNFTLEDRKAVDVLTNAGLLHYFVTGQEQ